MWPQGWNNTAAFLSEQTTHSSICGGTTKKGLKTFVLHVLLGKNRCFWYLGSWLDLILADETLLDARRAEWTGGDVSTGPEQSVSLHVWTHHTLLQRLNVAVQGRAAGADLATGTLRVKTSVWEQRRLQAKTGWQRTKKIGGGWERLKKGTGGGKGKKRKQSPTWNIFSNERKSMRSSDDFPEMVFSSFLRF